MKVPIPSEEGMRPECHGRGLHDYKQASQINEERGLLQMQENWALKGPMPRQQTPAKEDRKRHIQKDPGNDCRSAQRRTEGDDG